MATTSLGSAGEILAPVFAMGILTFVMLVWMLAKRIPAMTKAGISANQAKVTSALNDLPIEVTQVADNYNHLFEQPTLFYAVAISIAVLGHVDSLHVWCAWAFVVLRIGHSIVQATFNDVNLRFGLFMLSWLALMVMILREAAALL